jgi:hypothetical protein
MRNPSALRVVPTRWLAWDFSVMQGTQQLTSVEMSAWREKAEFRIQDRTYHVFRDGMIGDFVLQAAGSTVARASKPSSFRRDFVIKYDEKVYTLKAKSSFGRGFILRDEHREIGSLTPETAFSYRAAVDLPDHLPLEMKVFIVWLVMILWKRAASAAS